MRFVLLFLALVALVAAASSAVPGDGAKSRVRRHILPWGWDVDGLLHNIKSKVHHTLHEVKEKVHEGLAAAKNFLKYAFSWLNFKHSEPHTAQETIYFLHPGAVRIISFTGTGPHASDSHRLTWDGHHLAWEKNDELHGGDVTAEERLLIFFDGIDHPVPLVVLAKFLNHLHAGSIITVELRGSKLDDLRLVLHAKSKDHDNETTTVKVDHLLKKAHAFFRKHDREQHHKSSNGNEMHWDGHRLSWPNKGKSAHLRVTVSSSNAKATHVIPLSVLAEHLKGVPARDVRLEVHGKTLKDMRVELHVSRHRTISVPVKKLIEEANTKARTDNEQSHPLGNTHDNTVRSHSPTNTHDNTAQSHSPANTHDNTVQSHSPTNTHDNTVRSHSPTNTLDNTAQSHLPANTHYDTVQSHSPTNTDDNKVHTQRESDTKSVN